MNSHMNENLRLEVPHNNECPQIKNHTTILYKNKLYLFGGYDGKKNHNALYIYKLDKLEWTKVRVSGMEPDGRNGHTATLVGNLMYIIGGWLGTGTFASSDVYILNLGTSTPNPQTPTTGRKPTHQAAIQAPATCTQLIS